MSYREQQDWLHIDEQLQQLNAALESLDHEIEQNATDYVKLAELGEKREKVMSDIEAAEERWLYLSDLAERIEKTEKASKS